MPLSKARADELLTNTLRGTATPHVWLHTSDPGDDGDQNVCEDPSGDPIVRKPVSFAAPESATVTFDTPERRCISTSLLEWEVTTNEIAQGQLLTHISIWSAASGGQAEFIYSLASAGLNPVSVRSDGVRIPIGELIQSIAIFEGVS